MAEDIRGSTFRTLVVHGRKAPAPTALSAFIVDLLGSHASMKRSAIVAEAEREWVAAGGPPSSLAGAVKKAMSQLESEGVVQRTEYHGVWTLADQSGIVPVAEPDEFDDEPPEEDEPPEKEEQSTERAGLIIDRELGSGREAVYVYYDRLYRDRAEARGQTVWEMKIGMSTTEPLGRIQAQSTGSPYPPAVPLVIRTDDAVRVERVLHDALTLRGRRTVGGVGGGAEWFVTNPEEVLAIYEFVIQPDG